MGVLLSSHHQTTAKNALVTGTVYFFTNQFFYPSCWQRFIPWSLYQSLQCSSTQPSYDGDSLDHVNETFLMDNWKHWILRVLSSIYIFCAWTWNVSTAREMCCWRNVLLEDAVGSFTNRGVWLSNSKMSDVFRFN